MMNGDGKGGIIPSPSLGDTFGGRVCCKAETGPKTTGGAMAMVPGSRQSAVEDGVSPSGFHDAPAPERAISLREHQYTTFGDAIAQARFLHG